MVLIEKGITPAARLQSAIAESGHKDLTAFARAHSLSRSVLYHHVSGTRPLNQKYAEIYAQVLSVSPQWLLYGGKPATVIQVPVKYTVSYKWTPDIDIGLSVHRTVELPALRKFPPVPLFAAFTDDQLGLFYPHGTFFICTETGKGANRTPLGYLVREHHKPNLERYLPWFATPDGHFANPVEPDKQRTLRQFEASRLLVGEIFGIWFISA